MKKILILSHCILNNAAKVAQEEGELEAEYKDRNRLMELILSEDVQMLQLPCPEMSIFGSRRWGHVKDQFDYPFFRSECRKMLEPVLLQIEDYANSPERFEIVGVVSVEGSPSCGHKLTCRGDWGGELGDDFQQKLVQVESVEMTEEPGVFMDELEAMLNDRQIDVPVITMPEAISILEK